MPLIMCDANKEYTIKKVNGNDKTKQFLENLGFTKNAKINIVSKNNGNIIVNIRDTRIAINSTLTSKIIVA